MLSVPPVTCWQSLARAEVHAGSQLPVCAIPLPTLLPDDALKQPGHLLEAIQVLLSVVEDLCQEGCSVLGRGLPLENQIGSDLHPCRRITSSENFYLPEEAFKAGTMSSSSHQARAW